MSKTWKMLPLLGAACLAGWLGGCSRQEASAPAPDDLLWHVPAETAYVLHNRRPLPGDFTEKWLALTGQLVGWYRELLAREMADSDDSEEVRLFRLIDGLLAEIAGNLSPDGLPRLGLRADGRSVVFADGVLPWGRQEIADRARLWAFIARVEDRLGAQAERGRYGEVDYLRAPFGDLVFLLGTPGDELAWALVPRQREEASLPRLFGEKRPSPSLAESGEFERLLEAEGFPGYGDGYVDLRRFADAVGELPGAGESLIPVGCRPLGDRVLAAVPRMVLGTTAVSGGSFSSRMLIETDAVVGERLSGLAYPVPGMGSTSDVLFAFGMAVDIPRLRGSLRELLRYVADAGGDCPAVDPAAIERALPQLDVALGPMTAMFKGFYLELFDLEMQAGGQAPERVRLRAVAEVDDPRGVFAMAGMVNPELARLDVPTDGTPTAIPAGLLPPESPPLSVAIRDRSLVLAAGSDAGGLAGELVAAAPAAPPPLLVARYDVARFAELMGALGEQYVAAMAAQSGQDPEQLLAELEASRRMYEAYDRASLTVTAGKRGIRIDQTVKLK
jgi:hypothetical protein